MENQMLKPQQYYWIPPFVFTTDSTYGHLTSEHCQNTVLGGVHTAPLIFVINLLPFISSNALAARNARNE
jgi:hypothetical protein